MQFKNLFSRAALFAAAVGIGSSPAWAGVAQRVQRATVGPVQVLVYPMEVKDVVAVAGVMPLGDATVATRSTNPAIANLTGMLVQQGTTLHDKYQIADTLAALGAETAINTSDTEVTLQAKSLRKDMPQVLGLVLEQLRTPAFAPSEFALAKAQLGAMLQHAGDDTDTRAYLALTSKLFAADSPNAPVPLEQLQQAVNTVTLDQLKAFHARYYGPAHMTLVFTGDVTLDAARAAVKSAIAGWHGGVDFDRTVAASPAAREATVKVPLKDKASVSVMWGQALSLKPTDADYLPLAVAVDVLGSGFTGRLMSTVRDKEGLTYGIGANLFADDVVPGGIMVQATFAPELLAKGVASTQREVKRWWQDGITAAELDARKQALAGAWQLRMGTTQGMAGTLLHTVIRGQDVEWLDAYPTALKALTLDAVNGAIQRYVEPAHFVRAESGSSI